MKANAPEKIYLQEPTKVRTEKKYDNDVEYVRNDAFIKKACEWLEENKDHPLIGCEDPCLSGYLTSSFIEDFRKAMKGE